LFIIKTTLGRMPRAQPMAKEGSLREEHFCFGIKENGESCSAVGGSVEGSGN